MTADERIAALVADLQPVRPVLAWHGIAITAAAAALVSVAVALQFGLRADLFALSPQPVVLLRGGLLLAAGFAALLAAAGSAHPEKAPSAGAVRLACGFVLMLPAALLLAVLRAGAVADAAAPAWSELAAWQTCLGISFGAAAVIGSVLTLWLRRGAPTDLARSGWLTGIAAGALGTLAYSLHCPSQGIAFAGLLYPLGVAVPAIIARLWVPRLIRW